MLHLSDGRDHGYMWDTGRKLKCDAGLHDGTTVFFMLPGRYDPIPMAVENNTVPVPDEAWHKEGKFIVFLYAMDSTGRYTRTSRTFTVKYAPKPNNYAYTPTEVLDWHTLEKRLEDLEGEGLANAVAEYLKENPVEAGATAEEAAQIQQNKTNIATLDRTKLAASELPNAVNEALAQAKASGVFNGDDYVLTEADKQEIAQEAADMVEPSAPDLTGYATEEYVNETAETLRGEIPVKQIEYLTDLPEFISTHPFILVLNTAHNPTGTNWTGTLIVTRGYFNYGVYDFSAIDGAGACYQGAVSLRDNSINLNLVDSLESKATKEYVDEAVGNVDIPTKLPNPNALTFTGAATGTYDGSAPLTVNIPAGGGGAGEWELLAEGTAGTTNPSKANINLLSFGKKQYYIDIDFNKTTVECMPAIHPPGVGMMLVGGYKSSMYAQKGTLFAEVIDGNLFGYCGIVHGYSNVVGTHMVFGGSPRGFTSDASGTVAISVQQYVASDETLATYRVYGR